MLIKNKQSWGESESNVTPEDVYLNRRSFMKGAGVVAATAFSSAARADWFSSDKVERVLNPLEFSPDTSEREQVTPYEAVTAYNNFYEFGTGKDDPAENAWKMKVDPWRVKVTGLTDKAGAYNLEDLIDYKALEERVYRLRCVEGWSMVIPWIGVPLADVIKKLEPKSTAKYVVFETLRNKQQMPGTKWPVLDWPYTEGLRMDEALNPLPMLAVGLYGKELPNQNGAPIRLVVPWKYGFKSIKSIVNIHFTDKRRRTSWEKSAPREYGFYSNVNPNVDHPRWSQASERRIGEFGRRKTLMFNGYSEMVAGLYAGMDLTKNY